MPDMLIKILMTIFLFIITGILAYLGLIAKGFLKKFFNSIDILGWKVSAINKGCEVADKTGEYAKARDAEYADLIEQDQLINKNRF